MVSAILLAITLLAAHQGQYSQYVYEGPPRAPGQYQFLDVNTAKYPLMHKNIAEKSLEGIDAWFTKIPIVIRVYDSPSLDALTAGDMMEWRLSETCWRRFLITDISQFDILKLATPELQPPIHPGALSRDFLVDMVTAPFSSPPYGPRTAGYCDGERVQNFDGSVLDTVGPFPDLGGPSLTQPIMHGLCIRVETGECRPFFFTILPEGWDETGLLQSGPKLFPIGAQDVFPDNSWRNWSVGALSSIWRGGEADTYAETRIINGKPALIQYQPGASWAIVTIIDRATATITSERLPHPLPETRSP